MKIENKILGKIPADWDNYETILANHVYIDGLKLMKVLKYGKVAFLRTFPTGSLGRTTTRPTAIDISTVLNPELSVQ